MENETFNIAYSTIENGQRVFKIGKLMFKKGVPLIIVRELPGGKRVCIPIPEVARCKLVKTASKDIPYHFPDVLIPPPDNEVPPESKN